LGCQKGRGGLHINLMSTAMDQQEEEQLALRKCIEGDDQALGFLRGRYQPRLMPILISRGASQTEAEDLLADLWGDCVGQGETRPCLLEKFSGKCGFQNWLITVATNRLIDLKRKQIRHKTFVVPDDPEGGTTFINKVPGKASVQEESSLIGLLRSSLEQAFTQCPSEGLLMLRLVYLHGLSQRELATMWGCHEATISRAVAQAMKGIEKATMEELKKRDPGVELSWEDFVQLCETQEVGFL
jgi:RNA polymerase sigma factor (sigma-70 family)